tara:strand:- start:1464 stop:2327 length:864 start_codon:yes stop_codon:yes gene_type:complete
MTTYKKIYGQNIQIVSSDPSNPTLGQIWYNTSTNKLKGFRASAGGVWSTGTDMNTARSEMATAGTYTASVVFGGRNAPASPQFGGNITKADKWNGSSWTLDSNSMNNTRAGAGGCGTQTAAVTFGGFSYPPYIVHSATELYNGSSWTTAPNSMPSNYALMGSFGTQTAGLLFSGNPDPTPITQATEKWNGSSWSNTGNFPTPGKHSLAGSGTQTSALAFGGSPPPIATNTDQFNGSTWSAKNNMGTARYQLKGFGTTSTSLAVGGTLGGVSRTFVEDWTPEATVAIF